MTTKTGTVANGAVSVRADPDSAELAIENGTSTHPRCRLTAATLPELRTKLAAAVAFTAAPGSASSQKDLLTSPRGANAYSLGITANASGTVVLILTDHRGFSGRAVLTTDDVLALSELLK